MRQAALRVTSVISTAFLALGLFAAPPAAKEKVRKPYGIEKRELWTTSRVHGTPDPPNPYGTAVAFPNLQFDEPLTMTVVPGTNRLAVAERGGRIYTFENDLATSRKDLLLDTGRPTFGLVFHPQFAENGYLYVFMHLLDDPSDFSPDGSRVSRYQADTRRPLQADPSSEEVLFVWRAGGHNGGCLQFGPDGYLYAALGDASGIADELNTGQDISDLPASILRIDVDHPSGDLPYGIPEDNPFVDVPGARGEIWAYGLRQVWKFSFDPATGILWAGEVGQDLWEEIIPIQKGGNYGWSVKEGNHPFRPDREEGPTPILPPLVEHSHTEARSITGGYVYHGSRLEELKGAYIYGDYDTGKLWSLRYDGEQLTEQRELADALLRPVAFGQDPAGEVYILDHIGGRIHHLVPAPPPSADALEFPRKLSETGLFSSTKDLTPAPGLIPYSVNSPLWSDGAVKQRYIALPGESKIEYNRVVYPQPSPGAPRGWRFPDGTVLVKTFLMEMEAGNPQSLRRLETRLLHHKRTPGSDEVGAQVWRGYVYVWNDEQTDAHLLEAGGADLELTIKDPSAPGGSRDQTWRFPSRGECIGCHTTPAKYVLGVNTLQMNKDHDYGGVIANQLSTLEHLGVFSEPLPWPPEHLPRLYDHRDESVPLDLRARSYLQSNCAHCHIKWGGGNADFQVLFTLPPEEFGLIDVPPAHGKFDIPDARLLAPGDPERSLIHFRMGKLGLGRMPHIASNVVDKEAVKLIYDWIEQLPRSAGSAAASSNKLD